MKEAEASRPPEPIPFDKERRRSRASSRKERWDIETIAYHLKTQPLSIEDPRLGHGSRLLIGLSEPPVTALDLFPQASAARIGCRGLLMELADLAAPILPKKEMPSEEESIALVNRTSGNDLRIGLSADGEVSLFIAPHQPLELEQPALLPLAQPLAIEDGPPETPSEDLNRTDFGRGSEVFN